MAQIFEVIELDWSENLVISQRVSVIARRLAFITLFVWISLC